MNRYANILLLLLTAVCSCQRPELWMYTDEFRQVGLTIDWSRCTNEPTSMTACFFPADSATDTRQYVTNDVTALSFNLPRGQYTGLVFSYSAEEYGHQELIDMDQAGRAAVRLRLLPEQPGPDDELYGSKAVTPHADGLSVNPATGMYLVSYTPEDMASAIITGMDIVTGSEGDLIRYDERKTFEAGLQQQQYSCQPLPFVWQLKISIYVEELQYYYAARASVAGFSNAYRFVDGKNSTGTALLSADNWQTEPLTATTGYLTTTISVFGLPGATAQELPQLQAEDIRLNLQIMLRDRSTVKTYHYNVGLLFLPADSHTLQASITLGDDEPAHPVLPYADEFNAAGFNATVDPWNNREPTDIPL